MKNTKAAKNRKLMNHYSAWKYVVLITTVIILTLSAIPTWFGEQPSIQLTFADQNNSEMSVVHLNQLLKPTIFQPTKSSKRRQNNHCIRW